MGITRRTYFGASAFVAAALLVVLLTAAPKAQSQENRATCFGKKVEQENKGTGGPDVINGQFAEEGGKRDAIKTFGGDDIVRGEADFSGTPEGNIDLICLGKGDDVADGADKADKIKGGKGDDTLDGDNFPSPFGDTLIGNRGADTFTGGQGRDTIRGGKGPDTIDMGSGTTVNAGADRVFGGRGDDTINEFGDGARDTINCGGGEDTVFADENDRVANNCENVINDAPPAGATTQ